MASSTAQPVWDIIFRSLDLRSVGACIRVNRFFYITVWNSNGLLFPLSSLKLTNRVLQHCDDFPYFHTSNVNRQSHVSHPVIVTVRGRICAVCPTCNEAVGTISHFNHLGSVTRAHVLHGFMNNESLAVPHPITFPRTVSPFTILKHQERKEDALTQLRKLRASEFDNGRYLSMAVTVQLESAAKEELLNQIIRDHDVDGGPFDENAIPAILQQGFSRSPSHECMSLRELRLYLRLWNKRIDLFDVERQIAMVERSEDTLIDDAMRKEKEIAFNCHVRIHAVVACVVMWFFLNIGLPLKHYLFPNLSWYALLGLPCYLGAYNIGMCVAFAITVSVKHWWWKCVNRRTHHFLVLQLMRGLHKDDIGWGKWLWMVEQLKLIHEFMIWPHFMVCVGLLPSILNGDLNLLWYVPCIINLLGEAMSCFLHPFAFSQSARPAYDQWKQNFPSQWWEIPVASCRVVAHVMMIRECFRADHESFILWTSVAVTLIVFEFGQYIKWSSAKCVRWITGALCSGFSVWNVMQWELGKSNWDFPFWLPMNCFAWLLLLL